ncbi:MAG: sigma 54-interacting transcriptional regulator [Syntrophales bacterium]|nr:sigma 54-interacting transcriptional regulator [Syntrophales bacterium]
MTSLYGRSKREMVSLNREEYDHLQEQLKMYTLIFESIHYGSLVTDADGYITHFNQAYGRFLGVDPAEQIGKHCTEVVENSRMHIVAKTGIPEFSDSHRIKGQNMVVHRIPIKKGDEVIAVFGLVLFRDVRDVGRLAKRLSLLESKIELYESELLTLRSTRYTIDSIAGVSDHIVSMKLEALRAAASDLPVMISGESGTGKEIFAQSIHHASQRKLHPFVRINCSTIPKDLFESELFGYEKGAFSGAGPQGKPGKFELANNGTIFLDEIGELPLEMQPKLLRVLEEKEFERVGGTRLIRSNFRLIAATNQNLERLMEERRFRKDLYYRLNVFPMNIPPLRDRPEDILPIARYLLSQLSGEAYRPGMTFTPAAEQMLKEYTWPGNVRELSNVIERALSAVDGPYIRTQDLPFYLHTREDSLKAPTVSPIREIQDRAEKEAILLALREAGNNKARASRILGIHRTLLYKKIKKHRIEFVF